jgi:starch synthase
MYRKRPGTHGPAGSNRRQSTLFRLIFQGCHHVNNNCISVLVAAAEMSPYAQTGGVAEVLHSLPAALKKQGCRVAVVLPAYRPVIESAKNWEVAARDIPVRIGGTHLSADILQAELAPDIPIYFIRRDEFYDRTGVFQGPQGEYYDNPERYIFFCRSVAAMCPRIGFTPDVILGNDWPCGLIMALLDQGVMNHTAGVFTVHNQGFLGLVSPERTWNIGLPDRYYAIDGLEYYGQMSLLKAGLVFSQEVTTVSPSYAREVQTPEFGHGLDGLMRMISPRLHGILNGVDYAIWNPETDARLAAPYSEADLHGKTVCKKELLKRMNLPSSLKDRLLIGVISRLTAQRGIKLMVEAMDDLMKLDVGLIILGMGEEPFQDIVLQMANDHPDRIAVKIGYDSELAHEIMGGADALLIPSLYEPCGLAQMYGLKYGTVPIVRATGGLNDTVEDPEDGVDPGTGFKFGPFQARALVRAVRRAVEAFHQPERWRRMISAGMARDFSWDKPAQEYIKVFERALTRRRGGPA